MNYILFDGPLRDNLLPFTFTRPVADIRIGILTLREKWEQELNSTPFTLTQNYLSEKFPKIEKERNIYINAAFSPSKSMLQQIQNLAKDEVLIYKEHPVAYFAKKNERVEIDNMKVVKLDADPLFIEHPWDIFSKNARALEEDFQRLTHNRSSQPIPEFVQCFNRKSIFIEEGADIKADTLNAAEGPIYIGKNAKVMEGVNVRGGLALGDNAVLKMGAKIYGASTIGPYGKVGGEFNNSVIFGYSNKGHDGFLGNSVIGEWCNIGADTNNSNLKNNYSPIKLWDYEKKGFINTGLQFCGLMMGDHSKCGINTMFNTGTVVGVSANIFGSGFPRNFIPSFSWGGSSGFKTFRKEKAFEVAEKMMQRRGLQFDVKEKQILTTVFEQSREWRRD